MAFIFQWAWKSADGTVLGYTKRFDEEEKGKTIKKVLPFFIKNETGEFDAGGAPVPRPLFNLPAISVSKKIIIVEGEKCAQALMYLGMPATTVCGGANSAKNTDWSSCAHVERVLLIPDADPANELGEIPGDNYIEECAQQIRKINPNVEFLVCRLLDGLQGNGEDVVDLLKYQYPEWDCYNPFLESEVPRLKQWFKEFIAQAVPYYPSPEEAVEPKTFKKNENDSELRQALTFNSVLTHYNKTQEGKTRSNGWTRICSPFASDSNPSFDFNEEKKLWHCFSSGRGGDVFKLIAELEGITTKAGDWKKVVDIAEKITGVKLKQEKVSNVTSIQTRLPINPDAIAQELCSIPNEDVPAIRAVEECDKLLRMVAGSDGVMDEFIYEQIKVHFNLKSNLLKPFRARVKVYRDQLKLEGQIEQEKEPAGDDLVDATRQDYLNLFPKFLGEIRRDIFSDDAMYWDENTKFWTSALNEMKLLKSRFLDHGERNKIRFSMPAVDYHFEEYFKRLVPRLIVDIPEWDGVDYLKILANRVELEEIIIEDIGAIDNEVLEDFLKEWHSKMWEKLENPKIQNRIMVLKGHQGMGKDYWQEEQLGGLGQFCVPMVIEDNNKDTKAQLHQGLALTVSEFERSIRQHNSTMKELLTASRTMIRLSYDARAKPRDVRCSFMASSNVDEILRDYTGNRRYILFSLTDIDKTSSFTPAERLQVLAQGKALAMQKYRASSHSEALMGEYLRDETPQSPTAILLEEWDEMAQHFWENELDTILKQDCISIQKDKTMPDNVFGFMPNSYMNSRKLIEELSRKMGYKELYVRTLLKRAGRGTKGGFRFNGKVEKGFFWCAGCNGDATGLELIKNKNDNEDLF